MLPQKGQPHQGKIMTKESNTTNESNTVNNECCSTTTCCGVDKPALAKFLRHIAEFFDAKK